MIFEDDQARAEAYELMDQADCQEVDERDAHRQEDPERVLAGLGRADDSSPIFDARRALARVLEES
jgi:hypothetical protein